MCEVSVISKSMIRLSRRTFAERINLLSDCRKENSLARLNAQIKKLTKNLRTQFSTITEKDYGILKPYLSLLIETLTGLFKAYQNSYSFEETEILKTNISDLKEIDSDIYNFRVKIFKNPEYQEVMSMLKNI